VTEAETAAPAAVTPVTFETDNGRARCGRLGRPNGKTEKRRALKQMTPAQRKAHRKTWKAAQKAARPAKAPPAPKAEPVKGKKAA
jgi:hypothetical protein